MTIYHSLILLFSGVKTNIFSCIKYVYFRKNKDIRFVLSILSFDIFCKEFNVIMKFDQNSVKEKILLYSSSN